MTKRVSFLEILKETIRESRKDRIHHWAAALAYYAVFSLVPLLLFSVTIAQLFIPGSAKETLLEQISLLIGESAAEVIDSLFNNLEALTPSRLSLAAIVSALVLAVGASSVFRQLRHALNAIWDITVSSKRKVFAFLMRNFLAILMVLLSGIFLASSVLITAIVTKLGGAIRSVVNLPLEGWEIANSLASLLILTLLFALLYKVMPARKIFWRQVIPGALFAAALVTLGKFGFGLYLSLANFETAFGAASSLIVFLIWIQYSALIFFFGAEITKIAHDLKERQG